MTSRSERLVEPLRDGLNGVRALIAMIPVMSLFCLGCQCQEPTEDGETGSPRELRNPGDGDTDTDILRLPVRIPVRVADEDGDEDTESVTESAPEWTWVDNPEGEECGPGCVRITFEDRVGERQWDIWGDRLVYSDGWWRIFVVDIPNRKTMQLPDVYTEFHSRPDGLSDSAGMHPAIFEDTVFYYLGISSSPYSDELVRADLESLTQQVIWKREDPISDTVNYAIVQDLDAYGDRLVTRGSTGNPFYETLGYHEPPWPGEGHVLIDNAYGGQNSLFGDTLVFWAWEENGARENIRGYDFASGELFYVTDDDEYQFVPRIHKRRVVWMDLRLGESDTLGNWENGAIFMKDLDSGEVTQITDGEALASYPDIHDDIVVWMDWRDCTYPNNKNDTSAVEIWGHNIATGVTAQITDLPEYPKGYPRVWGDKVYVQMYHYATNGVYMFDLPEELLP